MPRFNFSLALSLVASAAIVGGCGQSTSALLSSKAFQVAGAGAATASADANGPEAGRRGGDRGGMRGPLAAYAALDLTAEQKTALEAIAQKFRPTAPPAPAAADAGQALRALLAATTLDDAALRLALTAALAERAAHKPPSRSAELVEVRAVLTEAQRASLVAGLQAAPDQAGRARGDRAGRAPGDMTSGLNLTAAQKTAFDAFQAALKAGFPANPAGGGRRAAEIAFWQTGDASGLDAAPTPPAFPVEAFVTLAETLDLSQRQALLGQNGRGGFGLGFGRQCHGDHEGPEGPGGQGRHEGPGRRGGHEGPDDQQAPQGPVPSQAPSL